MTDVHITTMTGKSLGHNSMHASQTHAYKETKRINNLRPVQTWLLLCHKEKALPQNTNVM